MDLLVLLAERAGKVVSREELLSAVWPGVVVGDEVLTQAVIKLRKALGDAPRKPEYIETISKRGYRLIAAVDRGGDFRGRAGRGGRRPSGPRPARLADGGRRGARRVRRGPGSLVRSARGRHRYRSTRRDGRNAPRRLTPDGRHPTLLRGRRRPAGGVDRARPDVGPGDRPVEGVRALGGGRGRARRSGRTPTRYRDGAGPVRPLGNGPTGRRPPPRTGRSRRGSDRENPVVRAHGALLERSLRGSGRDRAQPPGCAPSQSERSGVLAPRAPLHPQSASFTSSSCARSRRCWCAARRRTTSRARCI